MSLEITRVSTGTNIGDGSGATVRAATSAGERIRPEATHVAATDAHTSATSPTAIGMRLGRLVGFGIGQLSPTGPDSKLSGDLGQSGGVQAMCESIAAHTQGT